MNVDITIFDNRHNKLFNVSEAVSNLKITTNIEDQPGKCTFDIIRMDGLAFWEGATVSVIVAGHPTFKGFVFGKKRKKDVDIISITAYDQLRYLKNSDTYVLKDLTSSEIFVKLCKDMVLKHRVVDSSNYKCAPRSNDNKPLYDIIKTSLYDTLINTKQWFIIRDNFGVLEHINIYSLVSTMMIGDESALLDFDYESTIDTDTYNQIKLYRDNKDSGKRDIFIVNDTINGGKNIKEWGILQLYQSVPENLTLPEIEDRALGMLSLYNNTSRSLKLEALGHPSICAGSIIPCKIADLGDMSINNYILVTQCTHNISNDLHTMSLVVEVVI